MNIWFISGVMQTVLLIAKFTEMVNINWWWIFSPSIILLGIMFFMYMIMAAVEQALKNFAENFIEKIEDEEKNRNKEE